MNHSNEINKRRTFAIISHPDAGKTTLTEKLLLYGGAINLAGSVKAKKTAKKAKKAAEEKVLPFNSGFALKQMPTEQTHIMLTFPGVPISHGDLYALQVCTFILGTGTSSMLNQRIREELGLVYGIDCWLGRYVHGGYTAVAMSLVPKSEKKAIEETVRVIRRFPDEITQRRVEIAKEKLISSLIMSREQPQSKFSAAGYNTLLLGRVIEDDDIIRDIKSVGIDDVKRVYGKYFTFDNMLFTAVGKVKSEEEYRKFLV